MKSLKPLKLLPVRERVASALRKAILTHELKEDDVITLEQIGGQLGVSSTPVREAFQMLDQEGLIKLRPNKGATVLGISKKTVMDHYETRKILESECVYKVCNSNIDITEIENAYEQAVEALAVQDYSKYSNYNQAFHMAIWEAADNKKIESILSSMWNGLSMGYKVSEKEYAYISMNEHHLLMDAIRKKDANKAKLLMWEHIQRSLENVLTNLEEELK